MTEEEQELKQICAHDFPRKLWNEWAAYCRVHEENISPMLQKAVTEYMDRHPDG